MKKYNVFLFILAFIIMILGFNTASAASCAPGDLFDSVTGKSCGDKRIAPPESSSPVFTRDLSAKLKSRGADVLALQKYLKEEGYLSGKTDGKFGKVTGRAVGDLQEDNDLTRTEIVDVSTRALLNSVVKDLGPIAELPYFPEPTDVVISGVSGPQTLKVGEEGTWTVRAYSKDGGNLSYGVVWGDEYSKAYSNNDLKGALGTQYATFTHSYSQAGTFKATFRVTSGSNVVCITEPCNTNKKTTEASLTVKVGSNGAITVLSPNGGEKLVKGTSQTISWNFSPANPCPTGTSCASRVAPTFDIKLVQYIDDSSCTNGACGHGGAVYTLARGVYGSSYSWLVGNNLNTNLEDSMTDNVISDGTYTIQVCQGSSSAICDSSNSFFNISSRTTDETYISITSPSTLPSVKVGNSYSAGVYARVFSSVGTITGGINWSVTAGSALPAGLFLSTNDPRIISGTPTTAGTYNFSLTASFNSTTTGFLSTTKQFTLTVNPAVVVTESMGVSFNQAESTPSQFVAVGNSGANDFATKSVFNFISPQGNEVIKGLKFSVGSGVRSLRIWDVVTVPVVNGIADFANLYIPVPSRATVPAGMKIDVRASYYPVGSNVSSGTVSRITLSEAKYYNLRSGETTTATPVLASNEMALVASYPTVTLLPSSSSVFAGFTDVGHVKITADSKGFVKINQIPILVNLSSGVVATGEVAVYDESTGVRYQTTGSLDTTSGYTKTNIVFTNGVTIPAGTSKTFKIFLNVSSMSSASSSISVQLNSSHLFNWTDISGFDFAPVYGRYFVNYPTNIVSVSSRGVIVLPTALSITTPSTLPYAKVGQPYAVDIDGAGDVGPYVWNFSNLSQGSLPPGLSGVGITIANGKPQYGIVGTPTTAGIYTFTLLLGSRNQSVGRNFTLMVEPAEKAQIIRVISPNGGESFERNKPITVSWSSWGLDNNKYVKVRLKSATETATRGVVLGQITVGAQYQTITANAVPGRYSIVLEVYNSFNDTAPIASDTSDSEFNIIEVANL